MPACLAYSKLLLHLVLTTEDPGKEYYEKTVKYFSTRIKHLEKINGDYNDDVSIWTLWFLNLLAIIYYKKLKPIELAKVMNKIVSINTDYPNSVDSFVHYDDMKQFLPYVFISYINNVLNNKSSNPVDLFFNNSLLECYIEAINMADDDEPCLIIGETGTGKEALARMIHGVSNRSKRTFWPVNCGGFTDSLFNSEISGILHTAATDVGTRLGAFLKASQYGEGEKACGYVLTVKDKTQKISFKIKEDGKVEDIDPSKDQLQEVGGTLFLDEVNSLQHGHQAMLLRVIQEKKVQVVGEDKLRPFNVKLICASNYDLTTDKLGTFRPDLYHRISAGIIRLPPLREMRESIPDLTWHIIKKYSKIIEGVEVDEISANAMDKLKNYNWPGNFRELENVLYRALKTMRLTDDTKLRFEHIDNLTIPLSSLPSKTEKLDQKFNTYDDEIEQIEKKYFSDLYNETKGNVLKMSDISGKYRPFIDKKLKKFGLKTKKESST